MAVTHPTSVRNAFCSQVNTLVNAGSGPGTINIQTAGGGEVAVLSFSDTAFNAPAGGQMQAYPVTPDAQAIAGVMAIAIVKDSNGGEVFRFTIGTTGADINVSSTSVNNNDQVALSNFYYVSPP
jgi:hypothetical protein